MTSDLTLTNKSPSFMQLRSVGVWNEKFRHAWAVILAGGDGTRLRSVSLRVAGDARPKQFCNLLGRGSLLSETRMRISRTVPAEQQLFLVTRAHEQWYRQDLEDIPPARLLVQPQNRGTGVAIALGVLRVLQEDPQATLVFLPSDHFYSDEDAFLSALLSAMRLSETFPESIVLLGAKATHAEVEYGWIEPYSLVPHRATDGVFRVKHFWEKPVRIQADELLGRGCFWNTFVTVGQATTFLDLLCTQIPTTILQILKGMAGQNIQAAYDLVEPVDFSREVLTPHADRLLALCDSLSGWLDLGSPSRLLEATRRRGIQVRGLNDIEVSSERTRLGAAFERYRPDT